jgi:hypothetical protein
LRTGLQALRIFGAARNRAAYLAAESDACGKIG